MMLRILLVEDNEGISEVFQTFLEGKGFAVEVRKDVSSAIEYIETKADIDIAVVDYWLVEQTAESVLKALHASHPRLPVILITGGTNEVSVETTKWLGELDGIAGFLQKPFSLQELMILIQQFT